MRLSIFLTGRRQLLLDKTPYEAYYGKKPIIATLRVFGSDAFVHVHIDTETKLDSHSRKGIFIGYSEESKAYRVYDLVKKHVLISRDNEI